MLVTSKLRKGMKMLTYEEAIKNLKKVIKDSNMSIESAKRVREAIEISAKYYGKTVEQMTADVWNA